MFLKKSVLTSTVLLSMLILSACSQKTESQTFMSVIGGTTTMLKFDDKMSSINMYWVGRSTIVESLPITLNKNTNNYEALLKSKRLLKLKVNDDSIKVIYPKGSGRKPDNLKLFYGDTTNFDDEILLEGDLNSISDKYVYRQAKQKNHKMFLEKNGKASLLKITDDSGRVLKEVEFKESNVGPYTELLLPDEQVWLFEQKDSNTYVCKSCGDNIPSKWIISSK